MAHRTARYILAAAFAGAIAVVLVWMTGRPAQVTVDFLNVGQGDAMLIRSGSQEFLIDGGPDRSVLAELGRAMPFFDRTIEYAALTHAHADHVRGLVAVLERYRVKKLFLTSAAARESEAAGLISAARAAGTKIIEMAAGDAVRLVHAELSVLWPPPGGPPDDLDSVDAANDGSLIMRLEAFCDSAAPGQTCPAVMFTGDASAAVERRLVDGGRRLRAQALKVGHHGSGTSTSPAWLAAVSPSMAVIEVGQNGYGHPSFALLRRLEARRLDIRRTDLDGGIRAVLTAGGIELIQPRFSRPR